MTQAQAQTIATAAVAAVAKQPTGMDIAKKIFAEINAEGFVLPEGKSKRAVFIEKATTEGGLTKNGASTYYQNLCNAAKGKPLYSYTAKKATKNDVVAEAGQEGAPAAPQAEQTTEAPAAEVSKPTKSKKSNKAETAAA